MYNLKKKIQVSLTFLALREACNRGIKRKLEKKGGWGKASYTLELCGASCLEHVAKFTIFLRSSITRENASTPLQKPETANITFLYVECWMAFVDSLIWYFVERHTISSSFNTLGLKIFLDKRGKLYMIKSKKLYGINLITQTGSVRRERWGPGRLG